MGKERRANLIRRDRDLQKVGPFNYDKSFVDKKTEPKFSMGAKLQGFLTPRGSSGPDPGRYDPITTQSKTKAPEYRIGYLKSWCKLRPPQGKTSASTWCLRHEILSFRFLEAEVLYWAKD